MPVYRVNATIVGSKYLGEYTAATPQEAEEMAINEAGSVCLCHVCSSECEDAEIESITVEEA